MNSRSFFVCLFVDYEAGDVWRACDVMSCCGAITGELGWVRVRGRTNCFFGFWGAAMRASGEVMPAFVRWSVVDLLRVCSLSLLPSHLTVCCLCPTICLLPSLCSHCRLEARPHLNEPSPTQRVFASTAAHRTVGTHVHTHTHTHAAANCAKAIRTPRVRY